MKKSELKALLKVITEEVIAAKQEQLNETKGLSGMKKAPESTEHTENVADSKDLTGPAPKEKEEGKKLPVVKKPANPQKVGSIKEEILQMIREEIDEMARVKGAVGSKFKVKDANSPTGWVVKGHNTIPDGTPTEAPKGPYIKKGKYADTTGLPTSQSSLTKKPVSTRETELAVADILKYNPNATDEEIAAELTTRSKNGEPLNLAPLIVANAIHTAKDAEESPESSTSEPVATDLTAKEKTDKQRKMANLRAYLMRKRGIKPTE
jgi:hypothetical protein